MTLDLSGGAGEVHALITAIIGGVLAIKHFGAKDKEKDSSEKIEYIDNRIKILEKNIVSRPEHDIVVQNVNATLLRLESAMREGFLDMKRDLDRRDEALRREFGLRS